MSRKHFQVIRHLLTSHEWDYFQFVEIGAKFLIAGSHLLKLILGGGLLGL
jgi:hypothetical protein